MPLLTLFTAPKPFVDPHIDLIQRNALRNWQALGDAVKVVVIGDEPGIAEACSAIGVQHLPDVRCNELGTPLISSIFKLGRQVNESPFLAYVNADILILPDMLIALKKVSDSFSKFLMVGQRWDLDVTNPLDFSAGWVERLRARLLKNGRLHGKAGSDYFIYPRVSFKDIPDFAVGRAGWDNWMIYKARWQHCPVVDATAAVTIIHQNHDYSHLPGGQSHYKLPETDANIRLAGGRRTIFRLHDVSHVFDGHTVSRKPLTRTDFWREVEIFPLVRLRSKVLGWLSFAVFHPLKAFEEVRGWLSYKLKRS
jgi:hypothetical protein